MKVSTTPIIDGHTIKENKGIVFSQSVQGFSWIKGWSAAWRSLAGGRSSSHEEVVVAARNQALQELKDEAARLGANAITGVVVDIDTVGGGTETLLLAKASGTAVII
ncbi:MAG: YbjQ family protein [Defluviitaleaceae bacterium]|nr:YbjQ family protein [Defluviitaleaceae bacterium]